MKHYRLLITRWNAIILPEWMIEVARKKHDTDAEPDEFESCLGDTWFYQGDLLRSEAPEAVELFARMVTQNFVVEAD